MPWQLFLSLRYLTSKRREKFISLVSIISILGVALGVAALIVVIAVMSGFDNDLKDKIIGTNSHILIETDYGVAPGAELLKKVTAAQHVTGASFFVQGQALLRDRDTVTGVIIRGIDPAGEARVTRLESYITEGRYALGDEDVIVGCELAGKLSSKVGDHITVISPEFSDGKVFTVRAIFKSGMYEYDANLVYVSIPAAQELLAVKGLVSGLAVRVDDAFKAPAAKDDLRQRLGPPFVVRTWMDLNKNFLAALKLEKTVMFVILTLIVVVACFNIASALIMTVLEKTGDIGVLKALGATGTDVMTVFALQGGMIGLLGTALGLAVGEALCWALATWRFITLPKDIYYIDHLPVNVQLGDVTMIVCASLLITFVATLYPSRHAARLDPVEALRYE